MTIDAASGSSGAYASLIANSDALTATETAKNAGNSDTSTAASQTLADKDTFMKLLVAQLKYQDPSKPADSTQFMSQTAQFSSLETMQSMATQYTQMLAAQNKLQASSMVGTTVSYTASDGTTKTGVVKSATFNASSDGGTNGEPVLNVDGTKVVLSKVTAVTEASAAASASTSSSSSAPSSSTGESSSSSKTS